MGRFSLLSTAGPLPESAFFERIAAMFPGHDLPDEALVRACLESYRSPASTPERLVTSDDLLQRSQEHTELLARLAEGGHRLGMPYGSGAASRPAGSTARRSAICSTSASRTVYLGRSAGSRRGAARRRLHLVRPRQGRFLFEVEWTAMLGEPLLRRHARIPSDERIVRFLVIAPERTELVRYKLAFAPAARGPRRRQLARHQVDHLRRFLGRDALDSPTSSPTRPRSAHRAKRRAAAAVRGLRPRRRNAQGTAATLRFLDPTPRVAFAGALPVTDPIIRVPR